MFNYKRDTIFESNNMMAISLSLPIVPRVAMHFQFTLDQSQSKKELSSAEYIDPNAFSVLFNLSFSGASAPSMRVPDICSPIWSCCIHDPPHMPPVWHTYIPPSLPLLSILRLPAPICVVACLILYIASENGKPQNTAMPVWSMLSYYCSG